MWYFHVPRPNMPKSNSFIYQCILSAYLVIWKWKWLVHIQDIGVNCLPLNLGQLERPRNFIVGLSYFCLNGDRFQFHSWPSHCYQWVRTPWTERPQNELTFWVEYCLPHKLPSPALANAFRFFPVRGNKESQALTAEAGNNSKTVMWALLHACEFKISCSLKYKVKSTLTIFT